MPLTPKRRAVQRRAVQTIDDEPGLDAAGTWVPFVLGAAVAVGSLLAIFYVDSLSGDRTSLVAPPPPPGQSASAAG